MLYDSPFLLARIDRTPASRNSCWTAAVTTVAASSSPSSSALRASASPPTGWRRRRFLIDCSAAYRSIPARIGARRCVLPPGTRVFSMSSQTTYVVSPTTDFSVGLGLVFGCSGPDLCVAILSAGNRANGRDDPRRRSTATPATGSSGSSTLGDHCLSPAETSGPRETRWQFR